MDDDTNTAGTRRLPRQGVPSGSPRHGKPDIVDFVGNSKISSFSQNPPLNSPMPHIWYYYTFIDRGRRKASERADSDRDSLRTGKITGNFSEFHTFSAI
jgi:hypothetical protein